MVYLDSLDPPRNLQANYTIRFLFHLNLILHACKIIFRCDRFEILIFATKQGPSVTTRKRVKDLGQRYQLLLQPVLASDDQR